MDASRIVEALTHHRALRSNPATPDGEGWKRQIKKELAAKGQPTISQEQMEPLKPPSRKGDSLYISRNANRR